jgi:hypothetical protein
MPEDGLAAAFLRADPTDGEPVAAAEPAAALADPDTLESTSIALATGVPFRCTWRMVIACPTRKSSMVTVWPSTRMVAAGSSGTVSTRPSCAVICRRRPGMFMLVMEP